MKYRAIIIDLDGTAVDAPGQKLPSQRLIDASQKLLDAGVKIFAATGRPASYAAPILQTMSMSDSTIVSGGTRIIKTKTADEIWSCSMTKTQLNQIQKTMKNFSFNCLWNDYTEKDYLSGGWNLNDFDPNIATYFVEIVFIPTGEAPDLVRELKKIDGLAITLVVAQRPNANDIHVTNAQATKEHAIAELLRREGISRDETIGVGDGHNDLHLFASVAKKVAMGNAVNDLKSAADLVIGDVKDDGLAEFFERIAETKGELKC